MAAMPLRLRRDRHRIERRWNLRPLTKLLAPAEQLAGVNPGCTGNLGGNRAGLHRRRNNPFLLRPRPAPATLHRRDHFNLPLVIGLALGLALGLDAKTHLRKAALTGRVRYSQRGRPFLPKEVLLRGGRFSAGLPAQDFVRRQLFA